MADVIILLRFDRVLVPVLLSFETRGRGPHNLSRRGSRAVGRSDAVLHHFEEAKPSRNGCIVVLPFIPILQSGTLTGSDSYWVSSPTRGSELGKEFLLAKKHLRPTLSLSSTTQPNTNRSPSGLRTYKRRLWVDGGTTRHPFREGFASPKRCKTASDLPTTRDPRRDRS